MKELEPPSKDSIEISQNIPIGEKKLDGLRLRRGQKLYEINNETGEVSEATFESQIVDFSSGDLISKVIIKPNHKYIPAINRKVAADKFAKYLLSKFKRK